MNSMNDFSPKTAAIWFWSLVSFSAVLWVILPAVFHTAYRVTDVIELQGIAKEWVLSTRKHPMLPAWILEIVNIITNRNFVAPFIASQICVIISLWSVWQLGRKVLSEKSALIGTLAILPYYFFTYHSLVYNQNLTLIAFWSLSIYLFFQAYQTNRILYWILSGVSIGIAFHAKYPAAFLVVSMLIFMFTQPEGRKKWYGIGPYLTTIIAFLIFVPHIIWLYQNDFATFDYANHRYTYSKQIFRIIAPSFFVLYQMEHWLPTVIILYPALDFIWRWKFKTLKNENEKQCAKYLFCCFMIPFLICIAVMVIKNYWLSASYGAPFWTYLGIWLLLQFQSKELPNTFFHTLKLVAVLEVVMILLLLCGVFTPYLNGKPKKQLFATNDFGVKCDQIWYSRFEIPCRYVTGDWPLCGYACYAMRDRPSLHYYWNIYDEGISNMNAKPSGTWATDSDLNQKGGMIVWNISNNKSDNYVPDWVYKRFPKAEVISEPIILPYKTRANVPPIKIGAAIIPP
ncbi:MAG: glycosyltransferase family 39 protein [Planctomycetaceae bacterium]|jgi:4-amino-4-deoxy-L-arabinose transferase-like glycosyltransferase|nr:glycosyltransferase family 39 protein [Planctomycetaceae bacterium]